jgi:hypothetical protein
MTDMHAASNRLIAMHIARERAENILTQLGGNRFRVMTGAKDFVADGSGLIFKIGRNAKSVSHVKIRLTGADLYMMEFLRIRAGVVKTVSISDGIYAEDLQPEFTRGTGLDTRL